MEGEEAMKKRKTLMEAMKAAGVHTDDDMEAWLLRSIGTRDGIKISIVGFKDGRCLWRVERVH